MTDQPMKNDNPPSAGLLLALDDLLGDMNPRNDYETCRAKYEALRAGIEALQTSRPDADDMQETLDHFNRLYDAIVIDGGGGIATRVFFRDRARTIRAALKSGEKGRWQKAIDAVFDKAKSQLAENRGEYNAGYFWAIKDLQAILQPPTSEGV